MVNDSPELDFSDLSSLVFGEGEDIEDYSREELMDKLQDVLFGEVQNPETYSPSEWIDKIRKKIDISRKTRLGSDVDEMIDRVVQEVFSKKSDFILEILQNAEDAINRRDENVEGKLKIDLYQKGDDQSYMRIQHNGKKFDYADVDSICGAARSNKSIFEGDIGFMGIGFKSVFRACNLAQIFSGGFEFQFDVTEGKENNIGMIRPSEKKPEPPIKVNNNDYTTTFLLYFRTEEDFEDAEEEIKELGMYLFLFLNDIRRIRINVNKKGEDKYEMDLEKISTPSDGAGRLKILDNINGNLKQFKVFNKPIKVDDKNVLDEESKRRGNRDKLNERKIVLAFPLEKNELTEWERPAKSVYSFLPLSKVRSGFPFIIQADFRVQPGRDDIEYDSEWNIWMIQEIENFLEEVFDKILQDPDLRKNHLSIFTPDEDLAANNEAYEKLFKKNLVGEFKKYFDNKEEKYPDKDGNLKPLKNIVIPKQRTKIIKLMGEKGNLNEFYNDENLNYINEDFYQNCKEEIDDKDEYYELELTDIGENKEYLKNQENKLIFLINYYKELFDWLNRLEKSEKKAIKDMKKEIENCHILTNEKELVELCYDNIYYDVLPESVEKLKNEEKQVEKKLEKYHFVDNDFYSKLSNDSNTLFKIKNKDKYIRCLKKEGELSDKFIEKLREKKENMETEEDLPLDKPCIHKKDEKKWIVEDEDVIYRIIDTGYELEIRQNKLDRYGMIEVISYEEICNKTLLKEISVEKNYSKENIGEYLKYCNLIIEADLEKLNLNDYDSFWVLTDENGLQDPTEEDILMTNIFDDDNNQKLAEYQDNIDNIYFVSAKYLENPNRTEDLYNFLTSLGVKTDEKYDDIVKRRIYKGKLQAYRGGELTEKLDSKEVILFARLVKKYADNIKTPIWIVRSDGEVVNSKDSKPYFASEYNPKSDYHKNKEYLDERGFPVNFLSDKYIKRLDKDNENYNQKLNEWKDFFENQVNEKKRSNTIVERFAEGLSKRVIKKKLKGIFSDDFQNIKFVGDSGTPYDAEIKIKNRDIFYLEVKGSTKSKRDISKENNEMDLTSDESEKAINDSDQYFVSIVTNIPNNPELSFYIDPESVEPEKIPLHHTEDWKNSNEVDFTSFFKS